MPRSEQEHREEIVRVGRLMFDKGWIAANDGNITVRLDNGHLLATPRGVSKGMLKPEDLVVVDMAGNKVSGPLEVTTEIGMHLTIYRERPDVNAVVHAHPATATGFAVAGRALNLGTLPEVIICLGSVPLAEYGLPGTPAFAEGMLPYIPKYDAMLLANHGAVAYGPDVMRAFFRMDTVEHFARIALVAELLGGAKVLAARGNPEAIRRASALWRPIAQSFRAGVAAGGRGHARAERKARAHPRATAGDHRRSIEGSRRLLSWL